MSQDLEVVRDALRGINEELDEYTRNTERLGVRVDSHEKQIARIENVLNGEGDEDGLKARVSVLERAERKSAKTTAGGEGALERVETARAVASKTRWEAIMKWAAIASGLGAGIKALVDSLTK